LPAIRGGSTALRVALFLVTLATVLLGAVLALAFLSFGADPGGGGLVVVSLVGAALVLALHVLFSRMFGVLEARYTRAGESESRYRALFNGTQDAIFARIADSPLESTPFDEVNDVACHRLGYSRAELLRLTPEQFLVVPQAELVALRLRLVAQQSVVFEAEERCKDGTLRPVEISTSLVQLDGRAMSLSVSRDISERKRSEEALRKLSLAVEQSPVAVVITDEDGLVEFVNPRFTQTTGYSREEILGRNPRILKSDRTDPAVHEALWQTITAGRVWEGEICNRKKSGEEYWEHQTISPVRDAQGVITHYLALKEDITARKQLEEQLCHSQKMEAIGLLAGGVAHDFNNLLSVILGNANMLRMDLQDGTQQAQDLDEVLEAGHRAAKLTRSLLTFGRRQPGALQAVDLHEVTAAVDRFLRRLIGEDLQLETRFHPGPLHVRIDPGQIEQVLVNLATNARDAMKSGGKLTIETSLGEVDPATAQAHGIGPGPCAVLSVSDTGAGIDAPLLARVFEPFFTTKEVGKGTGLGLAIVYSIVRQNAGAISVSSEKGRGTTFQVRLPLAAGHVEQRAAGPAREQLPMGSETVLVVEDEEQVRRFVRSLLERHGYRVLVAEDGREAVETFAQAQDRVDLVLMDLIMPRLNGQKASEEILRLRPGTPILLTSGYSAAILKDRGQVVEGIDLLVKPVQPEALLVRVRQLLDARKAQRAGAAA
jgi:two-component system NtrC family sensor kinase